jgi:hypothetical protein
MALRAAEPARADERPPGLGELLLVHFARLDDAGWLVFEGFGIQGRQPGRQRRHHLLGKLRHP